MPEVPIPEPITAACQQVRAATPDDAVAGVQPRIVAAPASTQEASVLLRAASTLNLAVVPRGTGSKLHWGYPPERCDVIIDTTRLNAVIEHAAGDLVATVEAGVSLAELDRALGIAGQRLALDPPAAEPPSGPGPGSLPGGTVGGVLATGAAGPLRLRYGTGRDLVIGITVVRPDGTVARSGGKVVKNVAGYDLGKLFAGSRGTLGLITQATFRLHPRPVATAHVTARVAAPAEAAALLGKALDAAFSPVAAELWWPSSGAPIELAVALEGDREAVAERADLLASVLTGQVPAVAGELPAMAPPPWWGAGPPGQPAGTFVQVAFWPGDLARMLAEIRVAAEQAELDPAIGGSAAAGVLHVGLAGDQDPGAIAAFVTRLRACVTMRRLDAGEGPPDRASIQLLGAPAAVSALVDLFGPVSSLGLMRAVKQRFDPDRLMSPGRLAGGI